MNKGIKEKLYELLDLAIEVNEINKTTKMVIDYTGYVSWVELQVFNVKALGTPEGALLYNSWAHLDYGTDTAIEEINGLEQQINKYREEKVNE